LGVEIWDEILKVYPKEGYFNDYYEMASGGEICPRFHFFVSATILGSVLNRKVWFQRGTKETFPTLFPNLWILLVAPQGSGHKSSALRVGRLLLKSLPDQLKPNILASKITPESVVKALATTNTGVNVKLPPGMNASALRGDAVAIIYSSELSVTIGKEKYNQGFLPLLTELYDCHDEWSSSTIMRGEQALYNVCLTLMGASTPDWMQSMLPQDAFKGGFMSRVLVITLPLNWDNDKNENAIVPDPEPAPPELIARVVKHLETYSYVTGEVKWSPQAKSFFEDWYRHNAKNKKKLSGVIAACQERKQDHLLRLAILLQLNSTPTELVLQRDSIEKSLAILSTVEKESTSTIEFIATEPNMRSAQTVLEYLRKYRQLPEWELLHLVWRNLKHPKEFDSVLEMLMKSRDIEPIDLKDEKGKTTLGFKYIGQASTKLRL
jgi:hypothetical protein